MLVYAAILLPLLFAPPPEGKTYAQTSAELDSAIENFAGDDRQASIEALEQALELVGRYPEQAGDAVPEKVLRGWLIVAGLHLAEGDEPAAAEAMDRAIRLARDQPLPAAAYGPKVNQLYEDRKAALEAAGRATIEVACELECEVVIGQRRLSSPSEQLLLGRYDVWVRASSGAHPWEHHEVELRSADAVERIVYEDPAPEPVEVVTPVAPAPVDPKPKRMLPRGAEIAGAAVGVGLVIVGAVLLSFDGKCDATNQRPTATTTPQECGNLYESSAAGFSLVGVGAGVLVVSGVMLSIDEVRVGREKGRQAMLGVSFRF